METDINKIKKISRQKEEENWKFRSFLKMCNISDEKIDSVVHKLYRDIVSEIDCQKCANCCVEMVPILDNEDIDKFSKSSGIPVAEFKSRYLVKNKGSNDYTFNKIPCPFLKNNSCSCYAYRPKDCVAYPHLHKNEFTSRLINIIVNCSICPIVFNVFEGVKNEIFYYDREEKENLKIE